MSLKIKVGCDPELFLRNPNSGKFVSAEGIVPGDKLNPHKVNKGTVSVDGFAAEIGTDPASSAEEFADNVQTVLEELKKFTVGYEHVIVDHVIFDEDVFLAQSDKGRELGCDPDFNAYTKLANKSPIPNPKTLRTGSGHFHLSWGDEKFDITDPSHFMDCIAVAKQMDWFLGVPSLFWGKGSVRRSLYGKAGSFRVKPYGIEYRTPDNSWLKNENRMKFMFNNAVEGMERLYKGEHCVNKWTAQSVINGQENLAAGERYLNSLRIKYLNDVPPVVAQKEKATKSKKSTTATMEVRGLEVAVNEAPRRAANGGGGGNGNW